MENLTMKLTKASSRLARTKILLDKIIENDEMCILLMNNLVKGRQYIFTRISDSDFPKMEKELEELEVLVMNTDRM